MRARSMTPADRQQSGYITSAVPYVSSEATPGAFTTAAPSVLAPRSSRLDLSMVGRRPGSLPLDATHGLTGSTGVPGFISAASGPTQMIPRLLGTPPLMMGACEPDRGLRKSKRVSEVGETNEAIENMASIHDVLGDVQMTLVKLQHENSTLKAKLLKSMRSSLRKFFVASSRCLLTHAFAEWRDYKLLAQSDRKVQDLEHQRSQHAMRLNTQLADENRRHVEEQARLVAKMDKMKQDFDQALDDERQKATHQLLSQKSLSNEKQRELDEAKRNLSILQEKLDGAERVIHAVREGIKNHNLETVESPQPMTHEGKINDYVKEKLHEILRATDPRYLGRSAYPTVAEISLNERKAYAESSACAVGGACLNQTVQTLPPSGLQKPWGSRSGTSLHQSSHSTLVTPLNASVYTVPLSARQAPPIYWKPR